MIDGQVGFLSKHARDHYAGNLRLRWLARLQRGR
jgi:hypothetical protein